MTDREPTAAENALRARISALSAASLRISASLDLETVLNEVVESARALTGARFGAIATIDEAGAPQDFVTSGFTEEEHRAHRGVVRGPAALRALPRPAGAAPARRRPGLCAFELGFTTDRLPSKTFQGTPMRHRGDHVGNFYLVEKEGGEAFTDEDEEILVLFASQAATAIANARTYRAERRARADMEALIETSPVGVVVFDVATGRPVSLNREARRIVESLCSPGQSAEDLLGVMTCRFADGREIALGEFPLAGGAERRRHGARRGDCALGPRRAQRHHARQRDPDPRRGRRGRVGGGHHAGPRPASGAGADADGVPRHGRPRVARAADLPSRARPPRRSAPRVTSRRPRRASSSASSTSRPTA